MKADFVLEGNLNTNSFQQTLPFVLCIFCAKLLNKRGTKAIWSNLDERRWSDLGWFLFYMQSRQKLHYTQNY